MSHRLNTLESPPQPSDGRFATAPEALDLLADLVAQSHHGTLYARGCYAGGWNLSFAMASDRGFHVVLDGAVSVRLEDGTVLELQAGDLALLSVPHELATDLDRTPIPFEPRAVEGLNVSAVERMVPPKCAEERAHFPGVPERVETFNGRDSVGSSLACEGGPANRDDGEVTLLCGAYLLNDAARHPVFSNLPPAIVLRAGARDPSVDAVIRVLDVELSGASPGGRTVAERLVDTLLVYALRHFLDEACPDAHGWLRALRDPTLARALALIHRDFAEPWTLASLASASGTSRASLARHFAAEVGTTPMQYLTERRLDAARRLLVTGTASLSEVADAVGYGSQFSLSKAFKRHFGEAPTHFAAQRRSTSLEQRSEPGC